MSISKSTKTVLKEANLISYLERFQKLGADDPEQIAKMSESSFLLLMEHVGMTDKPFHVTRLLDTLSDVYGGSPPYQLPPLPDKSKLVYQGQPEFVSPVNYAIFNSGLSTTRRRSIKPYYGEVELPPDEVFAECTDVRTYEETHELITQLAAIYKGEKLNKYQQYINACAAVLAIRDPTLLARRSELIEKAREVNVRGGKFKFNRGFSSSKYASEDLDSKKAESNFTVANKHREKRLNDIRNLETKINNCIFQKEGLVERLKHETGRGNKVAIASVRTRLDGLEEQIYTSKKNLSKLRLAQRRSEKYYSIKLSKNMRENDEVEEDGKNFVAEVNSGPEDSVTESPENTTIKITNSRKRHRSDEPGLSCMENLNNLDMIASVASEYNAPNHNPSNYDSSNQACDGTNGEMENVESCRMNGDILTDVFHNTMTAYADLNGNYETPKFGSIGLGPVSLEAGTICTGPVGTGTIDPGPIVSGPTPISHDHITTTSIGHGQVTSTNSTGTGSIDPG